MKHLLLVRHAKSDWQQGFEDIARPLNTRGKRDAEMMAQRLKQREIAFDALVSSPAVRAFTTAQYFAEALQPPTAIETKPAIYQGHLLSTIQQFNPNWQKVILFGHNPDITLLVYQLTGQTFSHMPTCGMVYLKFHVDDWQAIMAYSGQQVFFDYPKKIP